MKRNRIIAIVTVVALAIAAVPLLYAGRGQRMHDGGELGHAAIFGMLRHVRDELELTDTQEAQLKEIAKGVREQNKQYRASMRGGFRDVAQLLIANPGNVAGAEALLEQKDATRREMRSNVLQGVSKALGVLTPEQRAELSTLLEKRAARFEKR